MRARTATPASNPTPASNLKSRSPKPQLQPTSDVSLWSEALFAAEVLLLHASPVYYGFGVPRGDGSGVVIIPGFLGTDLYLNELRGWLSRIGYRAYFSGIGINADCPNLLIQRRLSETVKRALDETGRKIHLIGHSLGGVIARSVAGARPQDIASLITLAAPIQGTVAHRRVIHAAEAVRIRILQEHGDGVLPHCYTGRCTCNFVGSLQRKVPTSILQTAIYTRQDGVVDWRFCKTEKKGQDFEVRGTHIGMAFNSAAYSIIGKRLAMVNSSS